MMADDNERSVRVWEMQCVGDSAEGISQLPDPTDIGGLPDEILIEIFSYLSIVDLAWCSNTCRRWYDILKEKKSLWEHKECSTCGTEKIQEVLAVAGAMPQLKKLFLTYSWEFAIDLAWPEATVYHHYGDAPLTWEPYFEAFDTECLVLDHSMKKNVFFYLSWVDCQNLSRIVLDEYPHMSSLHDRPSSLTGYVSAPPGCGRNSLAEPRVLGLKCSSSQSDGYNSVTADPSPSKCPRADICEEEKRTCPSLEELDVFCKYIWEQHLENICNLGPLRVLHIECQRLHSLTFVRSCRSSLEVLVIADCRYLLEDAFSELCVLKNLRVLHLSDCRVEESKIRTFTDTLPRLESFFFNGHETG